MNSDFSKALVLIHSAKLARRKSWDEGVFIKKEENGSKILRIHYQKKIPFYIRIEAPEVYTLSREDTLADDWEEAVI